MCKCTPNIRTPYCGKGDCVWPKAEGERSEQPDDRSGNVANTITIPKDALKNIKGKLQPVCDFNWLGKWRVRQALEAIDKLLEQPTPSREDIAKTIRYELDKSSVRGCKYDNAAEAVSKLLAAQVMEGCRTDERLNMGVPSPSAKPDTITKDALVEIRKALEESNAQITNLSFIQQNNHALAIIDSLLAAQVMGDAPLEMSGGESTESVASPANPSVELRAAASAITGYLSSLSARTVTQEYVDRLNSYYVPNLEKAVSNILEGKTK